MPPHETTRVAAIDATAALRARRGRGEDARAGRRATPRGAARRDGRADRGERRGEAWRDDDRGPRRRTRRRGRATSRARRAWAHARRGRARDPRARHVEHSEPVARVAATPLGATARTEPPPERRTASSTARGGRAMMSWQDLDDEATPMVPGESRTIVLSRDDEPQYDEFADAPRRETSDFEALSAEPRERDGQDQRPSGPAAGAAHAASAEDRDGADRRRARTGSSATRSRSGSCSC